MIFNYEVIRSKRKTITVSVSSDNSIAVRCPLSMSDDDVARYVNSKAKWLSKVITETNEKLAENESVLNYREVFITGRKVPLIFGKSNRIESDAVYVKSIAVIKKVFIKCLSADLINYAQQIASQIGIRAFNFSVRAYKLRWGCCDRKGKITFNFLLMMLPQYLQRYVIIHELCHTVHFNHSQKFWKLVGKFEPNYKICRNNIKNYDYLTKIY